MDGELHDPQEDLESCPPRSPDVRIALPSRDMLVEPDDDLGRWWAGDAVELAPAQVQTSARGSCHGLLLKYVLAALALPMAQT